MRSFFWIVYTIASLVMASALGAEEMAWLGGDTVEIAPRRMGLTASYVDQPLLGYLARPDAPGRHPTVVILHGCAGFRPYYPVIAEVLKSYGYAALALDSLGESSACSGGDGDVAESFDSYAALDWLARQDFVDPDRVALLGSRWAAMPLSTTSKPGWGPSKRPRNGISGLQSPIIRIAGIGQE